MPGFEREHREAARIARGAGRLLLELVGSAHGLSAQGLRDTADRLAHEQIVADLAAAFPADAVLSEEGSTGPAGRVEAQRVWIVDPLDGTWEYGQGRPDWAVHVAFWCRGSLRAGAVALPALGELHATGIARALLPEPAPRPRMVVSRSRAHPLALAVGRALGAEVIRLGSAGAKAAAVITGRAEIYAHAGGQYEWDSAAPVAVARAAGLHASRLDGTPLRYNRDDPWLPDLLVCRPELTDAAVAAVIAAAG